jgi:hypothetical protein
MTDGRSGFVIARPPSRADLHAILIVACGSGKQRRVGSRNIVAYQPVALILAAARTARHVHVSLLALGKLPRCGGAALR